MFGPQYSSANRRYIPEPDPTFSEKVRGQIHDPETRKIFFNVAFFIGAIVVINNVHKYL